MRRGLVAIALCSALSACGSPAETIVHTPKELLAAIIRDVKAQRSVHYVTASSYGYRITADVARGRGIKKFVLRYGGRETGHVTVVLVGRVAYARGDKAGLRIVGLGSGSAERYAGHWIAIPSGDEAFRAASVGVSLESLTREITPQIRGPVTARATTIPPGLSPSLVGTKVLAVGVKLKTQAQLVEVRPAGGLPLAAASVAGSLQIWTLLSRWNEPVRLKAPAHAIPIATVRAGA